MVVRFRGAAICYLSVIVFVLGAEARWRDYKAESVARNRDALPPAAPASSIDGDFEDESFDYEVNSDDADQRQQQQQQQHHQRLTAAYKYEDDSQEMGFARFQEPEPPLDYDVLREMQRLPRQRLLAHQNHRGKRAHSHQQQQQLQHPQSQKRRAEERLQNYAGDSLDLLGMRDASEELARKHSRGKRHNRRRAWTESDKKSFSKSRPIPSHFENEKSYEVEVREAQNSSLCNYTVIPIPNPGGRIPHDLEHIKCNHVGSKCQDKGTYCCIQTYRNIEVMYESGKKETLKVYSGCVCSLQIYGTLEPYTPDLDLDD